MIGGEGTRLDFVVSGIIETHGSVYTQARRRMKTLHTLEIKA